MSQLRAAFAEPGVVASPFRSKPIVPRDRDHAKGEPSQTSTAQSPPLLPMELAITLALIAQEFPGLLYAGVYVFRRLRHFGK